MEAEFEDYERNRKWNEIFGNIYSMAERFPTREAGKIENKPLNRYLDVVPYDKTRVILARHNLNYINASHVCVPAANRKYILTQGPLKITSSHFWLMIWEQKSKAILMLNNLIERCQVKCHQYWPNGEENGDTDELTFDDVNLKVELVSMQELAYYKLRKFTLTDLVSGNCREILHFHYTHWPDFDLPESCDSFLEFLYAVRASGCLNVDQHGPTVIHCSAGIGRSGTIALVDSCLVLIEKNKCRDSINVIDILLEMRKYRMGLIQTPGQLRFSFQTIIEGSKAILTAEDQSNSPSPTIKSTAQVGIKRSLGNQSVEGEADDGSFSSEDEAEDDEDNELDEEEDIVLDGIKENAKEREAQEETELRRRVRDEKRQKTLETIQSIKRKQKEVEDRLTFNRKLYTYLAPVLGVGVAIAVGVFLFVKKRDGSVLLNYE